MRLITKECEATSTVNSFSVWPNRISQISTPLKCSATQPATISAYVVVVVVAVIAPKDVPMCVCSCCLSRLRAVGGDPELRTTFSITSIAQLWFGVRNKNESLSTRSTCTFFRCTRQFRCPRLKDSNAPSVNIAAEPRCGFNSCHTI